MHSITELYQICFFCLGTIASWEVVSIFVQAMSAYTYWPWACDIWKATTDFLFSLSFSFILCYDEKCLIYSVICVFMYCIWYIAYVIILHLISNMINSENTSTHWNIFFAPILSNIFSIKYFYLITLMCDRTYTFYFLK